MRSPDTRAGCDKTCLWMAFHKLQEIPHATWDSPQHPSSHSSAPPAPPHLRHCAFKMASVAVSPIPSSLSSPDRLSASSPATSVDEHEGKPAEETIYTINHLIQARAKGLHGTEPIVAYPSSGTEYIYYTPKQVNMHSYLFLESQGILTTSATS